MGKKKSHKSNKLVIELVLPKRNPLVAVVMQKKTSRHKNQKRATILNWNDFKE